MTNKKPKIIQSLESKYGVSFQKVRIDQWAKKQSYALSRKGNLASLNCSGMGLEKFIISDELKRLEYLDLSRNKFKQLEFPPGMQVLKYLDISYNQVPMRHVSLKYQMPALTHLMIYESQLKHISFPKRGFKNLNTLHLAKNQLKVVHLPRGFDALESLYLQENEIDTLSGIQNIDFLISFLEKENVNFKFHGNPVLRSYSVSLDPEGSQNEALLNFLLPYKSKTKSSKMTLPAKVLLLGNHASGKSSLLHYLQKRKAGKEPHLSGDQKSTHIINIEKYPKEEEGIPEAIFYDFGGQDYYHGLYRIFLSFGAVQLLLWHGKNNLNEILEHDRSSTKSSTIHYNLKYWLGQNQYLLQKENKPIQATKGTTPSSSNPMLLIQRDSEKPSINSGLDQETLVKNHVEGEYHLVLKHFDKNAAVNEKELYRLSRELMFTHLKEMIQGRQVEIKVFPWYEAFFTFLLDENENNSHEAMELKALEEMLKEHFGRDPEVDNLQEHLKQLHEQGLVLFYPKIQALKDKVWLNPGKLVDHIHLNILIKEKIKTFKEGRIPIDHFKEENAAIIELLKAQKVLFLHEPGNGTSEYIVPNYLPIAEKDHNVFDLLRFGIDDQVAFVLKFESFIPFGFINQLICFFGELPEMKHFWRDQMIFTLEKKCKIFIHLDSIKLEIKVCITYANADCVESYFVPFLYKSILSLYWDEKEPLSLDQYKTEKSQITSTPEPPNHVPDLLISLDNNHFVRAADLEEENDSTFVKAIKRIKVEGRDELDIHHPVQVPIGAFQSFTDRKLKKMKKIFISYSNVDVHFKTELEKHLKPLTEFNLAKSWSAEELVQGSWHDQIQDELESSDIVIFMLSINFATSSYILKEEVWKAFEQAKKNPDKKMIFVLVRDFSWRLFSKFKSFTELDEATFDSMKSAHVLGELSDHQFLPYYTESKAADSKRYLLALEEWKYPNKAYMQIIDKLATILE